MNRISLMLVLALVALSFGACQHRNKKHCHSSAKACYPTATPVYGYTK